MAQIRMLHRGKDMRSDNIHVQEFSMDEGDELILKVSSGEVLELTLQDGKLVEMIKMDKEQFRATAVQS